MFKRFISFIHRYKNNNEIYFSQCQEEITLANVLLLKHLSVITIIMLGIYFLTILTIFDSPMLIIIYSIFMIVHLVFLVFSLYYAKKPHHKYQTTQNACLCFSISLLCFITIISIFPYPDHPAVFFPIFIIILPAIFILPIWKSLGVITIFEFVFLVLSLLLKTAEATSYDYFASITAWLLSIIVAAVITDLRFRDSESRMTLKLICATDELTELSNKATAEYLCTSYLAGNGINKNCVLFIIDIDNFKSINDTMGHKMGDKVLHEMGKNLRSIFREEDIVGRIGGDEFLALMKNTANRSIIETKALGIEKQIKAVTCDNIMFTPTCSIGIAINEANLFDFDEMFRRADKALYQGKAKGKNQYVIYSERDTAIYESNKPVMLIAENNPENIKILTNAFSDDYYLLNADGFIQSMDILEKYYNKIILAVINTIYAQINSDEILAAITNNPNYRHIKVIVITDNITNGLPYIEQGAKDMLIEPFNKDTAIKYVQNSQYSQNERG
ncbi:MAG: GGDEF domain-containing protein [Clostridiales bacterium]